MTIHKSKGLEFEVVIVPDLQAKTAGNGQKLLSWLERGLPPENEMEDTGDPGQITEFLVAPLPSKGTDSGQAKLWVDRVYRDRESQETRRILYVAATRARDELHLFARPSYKAEPDGSLSLVAPSAGLLSPAWPALEAEVRARFEEWKMALELSSGAGQPGIVGEAMADAVDVESRADLAELDSFAIRPAEARLAKPTVLRRLPAGYQPDQPPALAPEPQGTRGLEQTSNPHRVPGILSQTDPTGHYTRHQGGLLSRALGTAVHTLLEQLAQLRERMEWPTVRAALPDFEPRTASQVRALGLSPRQANQIAAEALKLALKATTEPRAQWLLSPQPDAASEVRWTGLLAGRLTNVRIDRVFRAGLSPQSEGNQAWWIIDYKTAHAANLDPALAVGQLRPLFRSQLEAYAQVLRNLHGTEAVIFAGLYYPRMGLLDWWDL
jgi:ATP-dependent exoDNAse (exonuclease V) beta subunit